VTAVANPQKRHVSVQRLGDLDGSQHEQIHRSRQGNGLVRALAIVPYVFDDSAKQLSLSQKGETEAIYAAPVPPADLPRDTCER